MTKFRKGDAVTVRGIVECQGVSHVEVKFEGDDLETLIVKSEQLTLVRRDFNVGDRVIYGNPASVLGVILAVDSGKAWVKDDDGCFWTLSTSSLRHEPNPSR